MGNYDRMWGITTKHGEKRRKVVKKTTKGGEIPTKGGALTFSKCLIYRIFSTF